MHHFCTITCLLLSWGLATQEKPTPPVPPTDELTRTEVRALEKRIGSLYSTRRKIRCSYCDGRSFLVCSKCKGKGMLYKYYPNTNKVDWDKTKACSKCRKEGRYGCTRKSCMTGFENSKLRKILWEMRSPQFKEDLETRLGTGDRYVSGFLKAVAIYRKDPKATTDIGLTEVAAEMGVDYDVLLSFVKDRTKYKDYLAPFNQFKILHTGYESKVRVREMKNGKVVREFIEYSEWIFSDGNWYLHSIRQGRI